jgi:phosphatidate cytidylyltransferase
MLLQRFLTAGVLLCVFVGALFFLPRTYWAAFLVPGVLLASIEWARLVGYSRSGTACFAATTLLSYLVVVDAAVAGWSGWLKGAGLASTMLYAMAAGFWLIAAPAWLHAEWRTRNPWVVGVTGWLVLVPMWVALVEMQGNPPQLLFVMAVVWIADTTAYLVGRSIGRRRLAPTISPGKTWEGVAGAGVAVAVYYALAYFAGFPQGGLWKDTGGLIVVAMVVVASIEGDLFESWMKRQAGVKDSGSSLPGHGGLLDRMDGLTSSIPMAALIINALSVKSSG